MKRKRIVGVVLALAVVFSCFTVPAFAQENLREEPLTLERRASGRFSITVKAGDVRKADTSFPLEKGDTVRIKTIFFSGKRLNCYVRNPIWMYREK